MNTRGLAALAGALALLVLALLLFQRAEQAEAPAESGAAVLTDFDADALTRIRIVRSGVETVLVRGESGWRLEPEGHAADKAAVDGLLQALGELEIADVASTNPDKAATFEVDAGGERSIELVLEGGPGHRLWVGKAGPGYGSSYLRLDGEQRVLRVRPALRRHLDREQWRERRMFDFWPEDVAWLELATPDGSRRFDVEAVSEAPGEPAEGETETAESGPGRRTWTTASQPLEDETAETIAGLLRTLGTLHADGFGEPGLDPAETGLDEPARRLRVGLESGQTLELALGDAAEESRHYASRDGDDTVYLLGSYRIGQLFPSQLAPAGPESGDEADAEGGD